ncbi:MAG TPA: epoxyqueuosine reductase, partial [Deltaproteobacteria bacterium]|nr:epoxyqueuosine reductase [Deltaproteobacteria bacterium]
MTDRHEIIEKARELGFVDIGFTTAEPFGSQKELLLERQEEYGWSAGWASTSWPGPTPRPYCPG